MPMVSVIIPVYNCRDFVAGAIESALAQTYRDLEVIVVNDGSTDGTESVLAKFKDRIKIIFQPNGGPAKARNTGVLSAGGEYVAFLDQDDAWFPEKIETQMALFDRNSGLGLVYSDGYIIDGGSFDKSGRSDSRFFKGTTPYGGMVFAKLFAKNFIATSTVVVRKSCFDKIGPFDGTLTPIEDYDRWLRASLFYAVDFVDKPLIKYRDHIATFRKDPVRVWANIIRTYNGVVRDFPESKRCLGMTFYKRLFTAYANYLLCKIKIR